jgi:hypothetical protein
VEDNENCRINPKDLINTMAENKNFNGSGLKRQPDVSCNESC